MPSRAQSLTTPDARSAADRASSAALLSLTCVPLFALGRPILNFGGRAPERGQAGHAQRAELLMGRLRVTGAQRQLQPGGQPFQGPGVVADVAVPDAEPERHTPYRSEPSLGADAFAARSGMAQPGGHGCGAGLGVQASDGDLQVRPLIGPLEIGDVRLDLLQVEDALLPGGVLLDAL